MSSITILGLLRVVERRYCCKAYAWLDCLNCWKDYGLRIEK